MLAVVVTALPAAWPTLETALPALGLTWDTPEPTEPAVLLTAEPAVWPAVETTCEAVLPAFCTAGGVETGRLGVGEPVELPEDGVEAGVEPEAFEPELPPAGDPPPCCWLPAEPF